MYRFVLGLAVTLSTIPAEARSRSLTPPIPGAPSALTATATSPTSVHLTWTDNSANETGFRIERSTNGSTFTTAGEVANDVVAFEDIDLPDNTLYYYRVLAFDSGGATPPSAIASATTPRGFFSVSGRVVEGNDFAGVNAATVTITRSADFELPLYEPHVPIPDRNTTGQTEAFDVQETASIENLTFALKITHSYPSDLVVKLIHPDGTAVLLHNKGGGNNGGIDTVYPTRTTPAQSLNAFRGKPMNGLWQLNVADVVSGDAGTLISYQLKISGPAASSTATTDGQGYYTFTNVGSGDIKIGAQAQNLVFTERNLLLKRNATHVNFVSEPH